MLSINLPSRTRYVKTVQNVRPLGCKFFGSYLVRYVRKRGRNGTQWNRYFQRRSEDRNPRVHRTIAPTYRARSCPAALFRLCQLDLLDSGRGARRSSGKRRRPMLESRTSIAWLYLGSSAISLQLMRSPFLRSISRCSSYSLALSRREAMLLVRLSMSGNPTLPVGEPWGELATVGGGGTGGCGRVIVGAGGAAGGGGGELRTSFGLCAADMFASRLWKEAADA